MAERTFAVERDKLRDERGELADSAHARDSSAVAEAVRALDKKLVENRFNVVVLGEFERGKTTFVNALLGAEMLPAAALLSMVGAMVLLPGLREGASEEPQRDADRQPEGGDSRKSLR